MNLKQISLSAFAKTGLLATAIAASPLVAAESSMLSKQEQQDLRSTLNKSLSTVNEELTVDTIEPKPPIPSLYEVILSTGESIYATKNGDKFFFGNVFHVTDQGIQNVTAEKEKARFAKAAKSNLGQLDEKDMIVFTPKKPKATVTVFTDFDCGFCRKLHNEVPTLVNKYGVKVRYLAFPRAGINSKTYNSMVSAWCAKDQNDALTKAKQGDKIPEKTCDNPVTEQYKLGQKLGVRGTPTIFLEDGTSLPGYVTADKLAELLKLSS